jgi:hypothetical protein
VVGEEEGQRPALAQGDALPPGIVVLARRHQPVGRELGPADLEFARVGRSAPAVGGEGQVARGVAGHDLIDIAVLPGKTGDDVVGVIHRGHQDVGRFGSEGVVGVVVVVFPLPVFVFDADEVVGVVGIGRVGGEARGNSFGGVR